MPKNPKKSKKNQNKATTSLAKNETNIIKTEQINTKSLTLTQNVLIYVKKEDKVLSYELDLNDTRMEASILKSILSTLTPTSVIQDFTRQTPTDPVGVEPPVFNQALPNTIESQLNNTIEGSNFPPKEGLGDLPEVQNKTEFSTLDLNTTDMSTDFEGALALIQTKDLPTDSCFSVDLAENLQTVFTKESPELVLKTDSLTEDHIVQKKQPNPQIVNTVPVLLENLSNGNTTLNVETNPQNILIGDSNDILKQTNKKIAESNSSEVIEPLTDKEKIMHIKIMHPIYGIFYLIAEELYQVLLKVNPEKALEEVRSVIKQQLYQDQAENRGRNLTAKAYPVTTSFVLIASLLAVVTSKRGAFYNKERRIMLQKAFKVGRFMLMNYVREVGFIIFWNQKEKGSSFFFKVPDEFCNNYPQPFIEITSSMINALLFVFFGDYQKHKNIRQYNAQLENFLDFTQKKIQFNNSPSDVFQNNKIIADLTEAFTTAMRNKGFSFRSLSSLLKPYANELLLLAVQYPAEQGHYHYLKRKYFKLHKTKANEYAYLTLRDWTPLMRWVCFPLLIYATNINELFVDPVHKEQVKKVLSFLQDDINGYTVNTVNTVNKK